MSPSNLHRPLFSSLRTIYPASPSMADVGEHCNSLKSWVKFEELRQYFIFGKQTHSYWKWVVNRINFFQKKEIMSPEIAAQNKKELMVLLQASLLCVMVSLTLLGFFLIPMIMDNRWFNVVSNLVWLACAGNNAFIYILLNRWMYIPSTP